MKGKLIGVFYSIIFVLFLTNCYWIADGEREIRTGLIGTNIIGIVGEYSDEPYIEIVYSAVDQDNPGYNKTVSIMVSPPYIFQNNSVHMKYEYWERYDPSGPLDYGKDLIRDFSEGGAEYFRIINHSNDKQVEFFIAGVHTDLTNKDLMNYDYPLIPDVWYKNAPIYFLLNPDKKPNRNINMPPNGEIIYFEENKIGNLIVAEPWNINDIIALYRASYSNSSDMQLTVFGYRMFDFINGNIAGIEEFAGSIFYGIIKPEETMNNNEKFWLLATPGMYNWSLEIGLFR